MEMKFRLGRKQCRLKINFNSTDASASKENDMIWEEKMIPAITEVLKLAKTVNERRSILQRKYKKFNMRGISVNKLLQTLKRSIERNLIKSLVGELIGASISTTGNMIAITGAALSIPTAGISLGLTVGGTVLSVTGGVVQTGSSVIGKYSRGKKKRKAKKEFNAFKKWLKQFQKLYNEYTDSLNDFFEFCYKTIIPHCITIERTEDPSSVSKYFLNDESEIVLSPFQTIVGLEALAKKKENRDSELDSIIKTKILISEDPCLKAICNSFSKSEFSRCGDEDDDDQTATCNQNEGSCTQEMQTDNTLIKSIKEIATEGMQYIKELKRGVSLVNAGSKAPPLVVRCVDISEDVASGFAKGASVAARPLSIAFGSFSLVTDVGMVAYLSRQLHKGVTSAGLKEVSGLIEKLETLQKKTNETLKDIHIHQPGEDCDGNLL